MLQEARIITMLSGNAIQVQIQTEIWQLYLIIVVMLSSLDKNNFSREVRGNTLKVNLSNNKRREI